MSSVRDFFNNLRYIGSTEQTGRGSVTMQNARDILKDRVLLFDGGMGTYYRSRAGLECEQANLADPEGVLAVHREYL